MAKVFSLLGAATFLFAGPALAHHSHAHYEPLTEVTISGTVTEFHWINPHSWVNISVVGEDGQAQEWALETDGGIGRLVRQRWTVDSMAPGDIIAADGTGAVCLPGGRAEEITTLAEKLARDDAGAVEDLRAGLSFTQAMAKYKDI